MNALAVKEIEAAHEKAPYFSQAREQKYHLSKILLARIILLCLISISIGLYRNVVLALHYFP